MNHSTAPNVESLMQRARNGDPSALGLLFDRYRDYLTVLARIQIGRRLPGKIDASDPVQETFLKATRHFAQFRGSSEDELIDWLRQILATTLANTVRHYFGTRSRDIRLERELSAQVADDSRTLDRGLVGPHSSPSHHASRNEQTMMLAAALERLPQHYREVIVLRHVEGLTFAAVAARMRRSPDSVEKLWIRALGQLRTQLGDLS
jgi:RNA polymerase sigma-70 factor (ECF subfamily)